MITAVIGSGGREHALALKISESPSLTKLFILPGNPGTKNYGTNVNINPADKNAVLNFCRENNVKLVVIGPEQPLVEGLSDLLRENDIKVFGPSSKAADIEAHKTFSKYLMKKYNIPTADYREFSYAEPEDAKTHLQNSTYPLVIKADGLAAGKGVLICNNYNEAEEAVKNIFMDRVFGSSGEKIIIEEFLEGEEASIFAITDGEDFLCLPAAQDHKRIGDGDTGKNTGGMGAYAPAPLITPELQKEIEDKIVKPTLAALKSEGRIFNGCLYCGLMINKEGPKVIEYNCRFGDPETQVVLPLLKGDFLQLLYTAACGKIDKNSVEYNGGSSVCVVAASGGYPGAYKIGYEITGLDEIKPGIIIYHAGTKELDGKIVTSGGRVLGVTAVVPETNLAEAKEKAYATIRMIGYEGIYYRKDISNKGISLKK